MLSKKKSKKIFPSNFVHFCSLDFKVTIIWCALIGKELEKEFINMILTLLKMGIKYFLTHTHTPSHITNQMWSNGYVITNCTASVLTIDNHGVQNQWYHRCGERASTLFQRWAHVLLCPPSVPQREENVQCLLTWFFL